MSITHHSSSINNEYKRIARLLSLITVMCLLSACATYEYHSAEVVNAIRIDAETLAATPENQLLDVGIIVFDAGNDLLDEQSAAYTNVRQSEAVWFSSQLKDALEYSNAWGAVRTMPRESMVSDLTVTGKILESNGEVLKLAIHAVDASGREWLTKQYSRKASSYNYHPEIKTTQDPFQDLFNQIANDLVIYLGNLSAEKLVNLRRISKLRFAEDLAPDAFEEFLSKDKKGKYSLSRLPADSDPMMDRIERIQARNDYFLDVVQDYYRGFNVQMSEPYQQWRKSSYKEVIYERQLKSQARNEKIAGVLAILAGVLAQSSGNRATRSGGHVAIYGGAELFKSGYSKADEAILHTETLRELGESLEAELEPSVIDLQDRSVTLSGTVDDQFKEWRTILAKMFAVEQGVVDESVTINSDILQDIDEVADQMPVELSEGIDFENVQQIIDDIETLEQDTTQEAELPAQ